MKIILFIYMHLSSIKGMRGLLLKIYKIDFSQVFSDFFTLNT